MRHVLFAMSVATTLAVPTGASAAETVAISCGTVGKEFELCKQGSEAWAKKTGNEVKLVSGPTDASEQLTVFQQQLSAGSSDIDVFRVDIIWPGILGAHFIDLKPYISDDVVQQHFPAIVKNNTVDGKLVAMPWFTDAGVLYYRSDLLEKHGQKAPTTWEELAATAKLVQDAERKAGNNKMVGFVFEAKAAETLTCNALEWIDSFGGGSIVADDGKVTIDNPKAGKALQTAASWIGTISPQGVLNYEEAGTRGVWNVALSKCSKPQKAAADLVKYLTSSEEQKRRAIQGSFNPPIPSLYKDPEVLKANPFFGTLLDTFTNAVARPAKVTGAKYSRVSSDFRNAVHSVLSGSGKPEEKLKDLQKKLTSMSKKGKW